jgi:hypothetical protein
MEILLAILVGAAFGAALDRVGATSPDVIIGMLTLRVLHLAKAILLAIGLASVLMFVGQMIGVIEVGNMSVKAAYIGVFFGGILLGIGWAISGFCPGTGVASAATGRLDGVVLVLGGLAGAGAYMLTYPWFEGTWMLVDIAGGKSTSAATFWVSRSARSSSPPPLSYPTACPVAMRGPSRPSRRNRTEKFRQWARRP